MFTSDLSVSEFVLLNEAGFPHPGRIDYVDPSVDPSSGTVQARGIFPNADRTILPGLFVRVRVVLGTKNDALLVPERALGTKPRKAQEHDDGRARENQGAGRQASRPAYG